MRNMKGLRIDWESGEGEVRLPDEFFDECALFQADVLGDWIMELSSIRDQLMADETVQQATEMGMVPIIDVEAKQVMTDRGRAAYFARSAAIANLMGFPTEEED